MRWQPAEGPGYISIEEYVALLRRLLEAARRFEPPVDCIIGLVRSGLFPAVFLSQQLDLPLLTSDALASFPYPRLKRPLVVDTVAWSGATLRKALRRLERAGVETSAALVMFARRDPAPEVPGLTALQTAGGIPRFWYDEPLPE